MKDYETIKNNQVAVNMTVEQLALVTDALQINITSLEERVRQGEESEFGDPHLELFQKELSDTRGLWEKLDALWWAKSGAEEGL
jgi:hypothetical protein